MALVRILFSILVNVVFTSAVLARPVFEESRFERTDLLKKAEEKKTSIQVIGNTYFTAKSIKEWIGERIEKSGFSKGMLEQVVYQLKLIYRQAGFEDIDVQIKEIKRRTLLVKIHEGKQILVDGIGVQGSHFFASSVLALRIYDFVKERLAERKKNTFDKGDLDELLAGASVRNNQKTVRLFEGASLVGQLWLPYDINLFAEVKTYLRDIYYEAGFLDARVFGPKVTYAPSEYFVKVNYQIEEGAQIVVNKIDIRGEIPISVGRLTENSLLKKTESLNGNKVENLRSDIEEALQNEGYPFAKVESKVEFQADDRSADIIYFVEAGQKVKIDNIVIEGNFLTKADVILRRISLYPSALFSLKQIMKSRSLLLQTDLFDAVDIYLDPADSESGKQKLIVKVQERRLTIFEFGAGASLSDGPRVMGILRRRNLGGLGIDFQTRMQLNYPALFYRMPFFYPDQVVHALENRFDKVDSWKMPFLYTEGKLLLGFAYPKVLYFPAETDGAFDLSLLREIRPAYNAKKLTIQFGLSSRLYSWLQMSPQAEIEYANFDCPVGAACNVRSSGAIYRLERGIVNQLTIKLLMLIEKRDSPIRPTRGYSFEISADIGIGSANLTSEEQGQKQTNQKVPIGYAKILTGFNMHVPLFKPLVWGFSAKLGHIHNWMFDGYIPLFRRFYLGGTSTVRGFFEGQILPADSILQENSVLSFGGYFFTLMRNEIRFPLHRDLEGAVFLDVGELLEDHKKWSIKDASVGCGVGLRYQTPIGPLLFDLGVRMLDKHQKVAPHFWQLLGLHFAIGY
jgi:outer membrane protein insertion porin family